MANYKDAGVDIKKAGKTHAEIEKVIASTRNGYCFPISGHYAGILNIGKEKIAITNDGVGSKILVAASLKKFDTVGIDCVAMVVNDLICVGARPVALVDYIALQRQDDGLVSELMKGLADGCMQAGCAIVGGETAVLPEIVNGFDLEATCIGVIGGKGSRQGGSGAKSGSEIIDGGKIRPGDVIVGLESSGIHSNGYTLARRILKVEKWGKEMLAPTIIYVKPVMEMIGACEIHGLANITGGGFSKLSRLGKHSKGGFLLDSMPELKGIMLELYSGVGKDDYEMYRTFNCGIGFCIICRKGEAEKVIGIAKKYRIGAQIIGKAVKEKDVRLKKDGKEISLL